MTFKSDLKIEFTEEEYKRYVRLARKVFNKKLSKSRQKKKYVYKLLHMALREYFNERSY